MRDGAPHEASHVRFDVLGPLDVSRDGEPVRVSSPTQRAILGILLADRNGVVSTDRLIDQIWGDDAAPDRQNALWVHISNLRKSLGAGDGDSSTGGPLRTRAPGYVLETGPDDVDVIEFERLLAEGRSLTDTDPAAASIVFAEALALWRGAAYADFVYEPWAQAEIARLEELRLEAVESRVDADIRRGLTHELVGELEGLVREHPTRERLAGALMLTLHRVGRTADALRTYRRVRGRLVEELGIEPSPALQRLNERIVTSDPSLSADGSHRGGGSAVGPAVRGYEIRERVGERGSGVLYRAFQPAVGREVIVKIIRPDLADDPAFIRRFEDEAQLVARLEHPHIVPLYDYWREPGAAYLVMRYLHGGTLNDVLAQGPLDRVGLATVVDQVGAALDTAHRAGIVHGNVSPQNVLVDDAGNAYLADFEIAGSATHDVSSFAGAARSGASGGRGAEAGAGAVWAAGRASDVEGFAVTIARAATGREGAITDLLVGLDGSLASVLQRATGDGADQRLQDVGELRRAVLESLRIEEIPPTPVVDENPYKGLRSFGQGDAADFFGRERFIDRLVARLGRAGSTGRFVAVVGPSGSGKSSVVRAGLLPALRRGAAPGSEEWFIVEMVPGLHPFEQLEQALLAVAVKPPASLLEQLTGDRGIARAAERVLPVDQPSLVLVVDQLEELFTQSAPDEADQFIDALVDAVRDDHSRVRVVATLRADFYDRPLRHRQLGELLRTGTEVLTPMSPEDLGRAVTGPAERVGATCEPALVGELVAAAIDRPAALPLLQYTMTELFERRTGNLLTTAAYRELGGVSGALVDRAEAILARLDEAERAAAQQIFLRLVTLGEGSGDTRRRVLLSELTAIDGVGPYAQRVTDTFARHRLLAFDRDPVTRGPTVEIAHEALLTTWPTLQRWIEEARSDVRAERRLAEATQEWEQNDRDPSFVLTGGRLARYEGWSDSPPVGLTSGEREFLEASETAEGRRRLAQAVEEQRNATLRRRSRLLVAMAAVTALVVALAAFAVVQQQRASDLAAEIERTADAQNLAAAAQRLTDSDPELANMLAIEAAHVAAPNGELPPEIVDTLHAGVQATRTQYPVSADAASTVRPAAGGGVFVLPPDELVQLAKDQITRPFTDDECNVLALDPCLDPRRPMASGLEVAGSMAAYQGEPRAQPLAGTRVELVGPLVGNEGDVLESNFDSFAQETGIEVVLRTERGDEEAFLLAADPDSADVLMVPQPGSIPEMARHSLMDLTRHLDRDAIEARQGAYLTSLVSVGEDGSWPAESGNVHGLWMALDVKSLIWYNVAAFERLGRDVPETWEELRAVSDLIVAKGDSPWCIYLESGGASGWPATDLIESTLLRSEGPAFYDRWTFHEIPFDHPAVVDAARRAGELVFTPGYLARSPQAASQTHFIEGPISVAEEPPRCVFTPLGSFAPAGVGSETGRVFDAFGFPSIEPVYSDALVGGGYFGVAVTDRPEVRAVMEFIASPEFGSVSATSGVGWIPADTRFDLSAIENPTERSIAELAHAALRDDGFRFDASDMMPHEVGAFTEDRRPGTFWTGMVDWFVEGPDAIEGIMAEIEASWPNPDANNRSATGEATDSSD